MSTVIIQEQKIPTTLKNHDRSEFETICRTFKGMSPPELDLNKESKTLMRFVRKFGFSKGIIEMFNHWIDVILPKQLKSRYLTIPNNGLINVELVRVEKPQKSVRTMDQNSKQMLPIYAVDHGWTYSGSIIVRVVYIKINKDGTGYENPEYNEKEINIGKIPIMLGSKYCWLSTMTDDEIIEAGECPNDPFGYFIINGTSKVINIQEGLRILITRTSTDNKGKIETTMTCPTDLGTKITSIVVGKKWQTLKIGLNHLQRLKHYPVFVAFFILYTTPEVLNSFSETFKDDPEPYNRHIKNLCDYFFVIIKRFTNDENYEQIYFSLQSSCDKAISKTRSPTEFIKYVFTKIRIYNKDEFPSIQSYTQSYEGIKSDMYSHIPLEYKANHLALCTVKTVKYLLKIHPGDDRDSWGNKRLDTGAKSMEKLLNSVLTGIYADGNLKVSNSLIRNKTNIHAMYTNIEFKHIPEVFKTSFQPNKWGYKDKPNKENITDVLKRENSVAVYSQTGRINTPSSRQAKQPSIRMLQPSQIGTICPSETPEGGNLGLLKNLSMASIVSLERETIDIYTILATEEYKQYVSIEHVEGSTPLAINGVIIYWALPASDTNPKDILGRRKTSIEVKLVELRRFGYIPIDCCIVYNHLDNIIEYFCDSSRPMRPLFVVHEDGELAIDKIAINEPDIWNQSTKVLLTRGCVELIDPREQEYIMLAMDVSMVRDRICRKKFLDGLLVDFDKYSEYIKKGIIRVSDEVNEKKNEIIVKYAKEIYAYYWGVLKFKKIKFDSNLFKTNVGDVFTAFMNAAISTVVHMAYEDKIINFDNDDIINRILEYSDTIASKTIIDIIDEHQRKVEVDSKKLPKPGIGDDQISEAIAKQITIALKEDDIIENIKNLYKNERIELDKRIPFTHSEVDPVSMFGISASLQPRPNCSQGPRSTYQASMSKQALGFYHYNHHLKFDKGFKIMQNPSRPMFETLSSEATGMNAAPTGTTAICAFIAMTDNNEDGIGVSRDFIMANNLDIVKYSTYKDSIAQNSSNGGFIEKFAKPDIRNGEPADRYLNIDEFGIPLLDTYISPGDCIIGKVKTNIETGKKINASTFAGVGEEGYVDRILIITDMDRKTVVKVKLRRWSKQGSGDKIASRYAQKGTFSTVYDSSVLPIIVGGPNDGMRPHFYLNPHSIPSRMSTNKLEEMKASKGALWNGERVDATCYHDYDFDKWSKVLRDNGMQEHGDETLMWPNGKEIHNIFVAPCYYQCLRHHVKDKVQMRARGAIMPITHQPVGGRANEGGLRMGEMERDGLISHGASALVLERLMIVSDAYTISFCSTCGNMAILDISKNEFKCRICDAQKNKLNKEYEGRNRPSHIKDPVPKFVTRTIPYVLKVIFHMLNGMGINTTLKFKRDISQRVPSDTYASSFVDILN